MTGISNPSTKTNAIEVTNGRRDPFSTTITFFVINLYLFITICGKLPVLVSCGLHERVIFRMAHKKKSLVCFYLPQAWLLHFIEAEDAI